MNCVILGVFIYHYNGHGFLHHFVKMIWPFPPLKCSQTSQLKWMSIWCQNWTLVFNLYAFWRMSKHPDVKNCTWQERQLFFSTVHPTQTSTIGSSHSQTPPTSGPLAPFQVSKEIPSWRARMQHLPIVSLFGCGGQLTKPKKNPRWQVVFVTKNGGFLSNVMRVVWFTQIISWTRKYLQLRQGSPLAFDQRLPLQQAHGQKDPTAKCLFWSLYSGRVSMPYALMSLCDDNHFYTGMTSHGSLKKT